MSYPALIFVLVLSGFLGFELIHKIPSQLHTPLMSGANAISGVTIVGALTALGDTCGQVVVVVLGFCAIIFAAVNVVGGYVATDRMLKMFAKKK